MRGWEAEGRGSGFSSYTMAREGVKACGARRRR